jgi:hypothetical protein
MRNNIQGTFWEHLAFFREHLASFSEHLALFREHQMDREGPTSSLMGGVFLYARCIITYNLYSLPLFLGYGRAESDVQRRTHRRCVLIIVETDVSKVD